MPRGDLRQVRFIIRDCDGIMSDIDFDEIFFTVKNSFTSDSYLFQKRLSNGTIEKVDECSYQFAIKPEDTDNLKIGKYVFDIELVYADEIKQTTLGELILTNEVTFATNEV